MRVGQKNGLVRQWAPKGSRPRQSKDLRTESAYLFGAICPDRGEGAALVLPRANTEAMVPREHGSLTSAARRCCPG